MFVFGEVQDPLPETVKMVEDIVRGQIIEIVSRSMYSRVSPDPRSPELAFSLTSAPPATSVPKTSSSSSATTEARSIA